MVINNNDIYLKDDEKTSHFDANSNKMFQGINDMMVAIVKGDLFSTGDFKSSFFENDKYYFVKLLPVKGENNLLVTSSFDANMIAQQVEILFSQTQTEVCIAGWAQLEGNSFDLLMVLAEQDDNNESMSFSAETLTAIYNR